MHSMQKVTRNFTNQITTKVVQWGTKKLSRVGIQINWDLTQH